MALSTKANHVGNIKVKKALKSKKSFETMTRNLLFDDVQSFKYPYLLYNILYKYFCDIDIICL